MNSLGAFENTSGTLVVSDPCYTLSDWCLIQLQNVKKGTWNAYVKYSDEGRWGTRCAEIMALHKLKRNPTWESIGVIGVDSGQAGIFDILVFQNDATVEPREKTFLPEEPWYSSCCDITLAENKAGVIPGGAVASSGYGDGVYEVFVSKNNDGEIAGVLIVFIEEEDEEEEEDEFLVPDTDGNEVDEDDEFLVPDTN